jgi:PPM family protein phosphatase
MGLLASGLSDIGMKRKTNQDSIFLNPENHIFIVADGMGGHNGGDIASAMAVEAIPEYISKNSKSEAHSLLINALTYANSQIKKRADKDHNLNGMGTTVVMQYFQGSSLYIANVGDSRCYLINKKRLYQLSLDHTLVQEKLNLGIYDRDHAAQDPQKNILVRTVGFDPIVDVDIFDYKVHKSDIFLTCSDGLHGRVSDRDILFIINHFLPNPSKATQEELDACCQFLIEQANKNGGNDNISVILVVAQ